MKPDIIIKQNEGGSFDVHLGDRFADGVTYDEMLGLVSSIAMPEPRRCLHWLKTNAEHLAWRNYVSQIVNSEVQTDA